MGAEEGGSAWQEHSVCRNEGIPPSVFFLDQGGNTRKAREYCARCPVRRECFEYGVATKSQGIWGGELLEPYQTEVTFTPLVLFTDYRPLENLVTPPIVQSHQSPLDVFDIPPKPDTQGT